MTRYRGTAVIATFLLVGLLSAPLISNALTCPDGTEPAGSTACVPTKTQTGLSDASVAVVLLKVANWLLGFIAALAVIMIIVGGIMYLASAGDEDRAKTGQKIVTYAIIGLVVAILSYMIVKVVAKLVGAA